MSFYQVFFVHPHFHDGFYCADYLCSYLHRFIPNRGGGGENQRFLAESAEKFGKYPPPLYICALVIFSKL